jgi:hypothetical protein
LHRRKRVWEMGEKGGGGGEDLSLDELSKIHSHKGDK